jgi:D-xylulose reductase
MKAPALVLERQGVLALREIDLPADLGPGDVRVAIRQVGVCGSDVHYYQHGAIGPFVVRAPMVLGHEASGVVVEAGADVRGLKPGDRVCMEPGIPDPGSRAARRGIYNLDPAVRFWATPPVHGCLTPSVVHPADYTFKLPDNVSFAEAAMVEPLAVGLHAATRAAVRPGDVAVVIGAGAIGMVTALSALAAGCARVVMSDVQPPKLALAARLGPITPVDVSRAELRPAVMEATEGWGADVIFEASGSERAYPGLFELLGPAGRVVLIGMPGRPVAFDVVAAQVKEARIDTIFRYAHVFDRALALMGSGKIDVKPLITDTYPFADSIKAFDYACAMRPTSVKVQINLS